MYVLNAIEKDYFQYRNIYVYVCVQRKRQIIILLQIAN